MGSLGSIFNGGFFGSGLGAQVSNFKCVKNGLIYYKYDTWE